MRTLSIVSIVVSVVCIITTVVLDCMGYEGEWMAYLVIAAGIGAWFFLFSKLVISYRQSHLV